MNIQAQQILDALKKVSYGAQDIVAQNMIEGLVIEENKVAFTIVFPKSFDPETTRVINESEVAVQEISSEIEIKGNIKPRAKTADEFKSGVLSNVKNLVAVASGKGGVGKSTITANLAVSLSRMGYKVGLIDADIFGPSIPKMLNVEGTQIYTRKENGKDMIIPAENYGIKILSIGFFVKEDDAVMWRGPMASNMLKQMIEQGDWGELDYLLFDLPPGTSDIHLTLVQTVALTGAVVVSTPQQVALADAIKGINMFKNKGVEVPVLGLVENMAYFTPAELSDNKYYIFGKGGVKKLAEESNVTFLGEVPIVQSICENGDTGTPSVLEEDSPTGKAFKNISENVINSVSLRNAQAKPTTRVHVKNM